MNRDNSRRLYDRALSVLPGGVNSAVRAAPQPYPVFIERGDGGHVIDVDGNRYVDWVMGLGPLLLGHDTPEPIQSAVQSHAASGPMYGMPTEVEVEHAEFVTRHVPSVESIRFVNSGTEATVSAVRLARGLTGRNKIVVMQGGYHGAQESTLVEGDADRPRPSTSGIPHEFAKHTLPIPFNDEAAAREVFEKHGEDIAGVLVEPIQANMGIVYPEDGYHETLESLCEDHGAMFIFDEVITGFRVGGLGCAQSRFDVDPDLTTFGKIIGGGYPVGAIGGKSEYIEGFAPSGDVFQAGTFSGNPVTMAAGLETLRFCAEHDVYDHVNELGRQLREGLSDIVADQAPRYTVVGSDSMFKVVFTRADGAPQSSPCRNGCRQDPSCDRYDGCLKRGTDTDHAETERYARLFRPQLLEDGILVSQNQYECNFVSYGHTEEDVERTLEAYKEAL
ncbi:MAG: glutamate-1-semialdehyde 2,1-aminomutase [Natronomonas sp.]